ncbi:BglG family transcription antiterminator [Bacillus sp. REN16]|uniref:BglG family transcription antiterminator n=1 Tax=Bacillus sp. REN16 TaxID=2887296 RepID=UPI001E4FF5C3|nr:PRD domain-containing protein [Bacillus sp. REN16]
MTTREKAIVELMVKSSGKHTISSIADLLHVSTRTIQRDLKSIEKLLYEFDLTIENNNGLSIIGSNQNFYRLIQELTKINPIDLSLEERRLLAYIKLVDADGPIKLAPLAKELGISITTLGTDLDDLTEWLKDYEISINRKKGVGVEIIGSEEAKREALVSYLLIYFNDELIESLFLLSNDKLQNNIILFFIKKDYLKMIDKIVYPYINQIQLKLADRDYIAFIIHICISLQRIEKGYSLSEVKLDIGLLKNSEEYSLLIKIRDDLFETFSIRLNDKEITYLVSVLRGSKLIEPEDSYYDQILISRSVKKMIRDVSGQMNVDLSADFSLFQGLMAHMEPTIYRMSKGLSYFNPLTEEIKQMYPLLFLAVHTSINKVFTHLSFSEDEIAYIVLHFGSALELKKEEVQIHALIVCPTGIGTSKMLASRIKNEIPEITSTDIVSLKEIKTIDWRQYQIIISTVLLPIQDDFDYVFVNPLLYEKDIESIQAYLGTHIQQITRDSGHPPVKNSSDEKKVNKNSTNLYTFMEEVDICQNSIRTILRNFSVSHWENEPTCDLLIKKMLGIETQKGSVTNADDVFLQLKQREAKGGLGIPQTDMAFFHCRHDQVEEVTFQIAHVEFPYRLLGMDGKEMDVHTILLLLAPQSLNNLELEIISMVSTIMVENKETMMIFTSANEQMIRTKLEEAFLRFLYEKFEKE